MSRALYGRGAYHDEVMPLRIDQQTGYHTREDLDGDVRERFPFGEALEQHEHECNTGVKVAARRCRGYNKREDNANSVSDTDSEEGP